MLSPMQKDTAIELVATIRANMYRHKQKHGDSEELEQDRTTVLNFKDQVKKSDKLKWPDVLKFSETWLAKYPSATPKNPV